MRHVGTTLGMSFQPSIELVYSANGQLMGDMASLFTKLAGQF
jgi:hypothetical protein